jgi:hypothetical protein
MESTLLPQAKSTALVCSITQLRKSYLNLCMSIVCAKHEQSTQLIIKYRSAEGKNIRWFQMHLTQTGC